MVFGDEKEHQSLYGVFKRYQNTKLHDTTYVY
jgi:hypothetical protein